MKQDHEPKEITLDQLALETLKEVYRPCANLVGVVSKPVYDVAVGTVEGALMPYILPTAIRKGIEYKNSLTYEDEEINFRNAGRLVGFSGSAVLAILPFHLASLDIIYLDSSPAPAWLIPLATNVIDFAYEAGRRAYHTMTQQKSKQP